MSSAGTSQGWRCCARRLIVSHLSDDVTFWKARDVSVLRASGPIRAMTVAAGEHAGLASVCYDVRQWPMIVGVPDWRDERGPELGPGITSRAVWHVNKITVVDRRLVVGVVVDISPPRRRVGRRGHGLGQRHANYCRRKNSCRNFYPAR